jgi:hypothetical protein
MKSSVTLSKSSTILVETTNLTFSSEAIAIDKSSKVIVQSLPSHASVHRTN